MMIMQATLDAAKKTFVYRGRAERLEHWRVRVFHSVYVCVRPCSRSSTWDSEHRADQLVHPIGGHMAGAGECLTDGEEVA